MVCRQVSLSRIRDGGTCLQFTFSLKLDADMGGLPREIMKIPKRYQVKHQTPYMGDVHIEGKFQPYRNMPFVSEAEPEDLRQQIIILGRPLKTLLNNMENGRCSNTVALAGMESALNGLRIALEALDG